MQRQLTLTLCVFLLGSLTSFATSAEETSAPPTAPLTAATGSTPDPVPSYSAAASSQNQVTILTERVSQLMHRMNEMEEEITTLKSQLETKNAGKTAATKKTHAVVAETPAVEEKPVVMTTYAVKAPVANQAHLEPVNEDAIHSFRKAYALYQSAKYPESILEWTQFLKDYPDHVLAGSAQYYLGDSYFMQGEYKLSTLEFQKVLLTYDRSSHISDSLKKISIAEEKTKETKESSMHRQLLKTLFASSPAAMTPASVDTESPKALAKDSVEKTLKPEAQPKIEAKIDAKKSGGIDLPPEMGNPAPLTAPMKSAAPVIEEEEPKEVNSDL